MANAMHPLFVICFLFYTAIWHGLPGIIALFIYADMVDTSSLLIRNIDIDDFFLLYSMEATILCCAALIALRLAKMKLRRTARLRADKAEEPAIAPMKTLLLIAIFIVITAITNSAYNLTYLESNDYTRHGENNLLAIITIVTGVIQAISIYAFTKSANKPLLIVSFLFILEQAAFAITHGGRIFMVLPLFAIAGKIYTARAEFSGRKLIAITIVSVLGLSAILPAAHTVGSLRGSGDINLGDVMETKKQNAGSRDDLAELFTKFDSVTPGVRLIEFYGEGSGGLYPYIGSALIFVPRFILPERPVSGSVDGEITGTPARLAPKAFGIISNSVNFGVSPLGVAVWQVGWYFGCLILLVAGTINIHALNTLMHSDNMLLKALALSTISPPVFNGMFTSPDAILKNLVTLLCIVLSVKAYVIIFAKRPYNTSIGASQNPT